MFVLQRASPRAHTLRLTRPTWRLHLAHRQLSIEAVGNGFLDLALALPIPPSLPPYSTTIILVTIVSRLALVPFTLWGINRTRRQEEIVVPMMHTARPIIANRVLEKMREQRITVKANKDKLPQIFNERNMAALKEHYRRLLDDYRCAPLPTIMVPVLSQMPVFIGITFLLSHLSQGATPFDSESFLTLTSLVHPDPTMALPILLGCLTLAQVESGNWLLSATEHDQQRKLDEQLAGKPNAGKALKSTLRLLSVFRMVIAALTPGSVELYWVTSATFGLGQTYVLNWFNVRRRQRLGLEGTTPAPSSAMPKIGAQATSGKRSKQ